MGNVGVTVTALVTGDAALTPAGFAAMCVALLLLWVLS